MRCCLKDKTVLTLDYKGVMFGWARAIIFPIERDENGNVTKIVYCLRNINGEKEKEISQQAALEERMAIIKGLAEEYFSVMIVDLESDSARIYRESGDCGRRIGEFFARYGTWSEGVKAYSEKFVADEDRVEFYRLLSLRGLRSAMTDFGANYVMRNDSGVSHIQFAARGYFGCIKGKKLNFGG